jgi:hypothetical protein
VPLSWSIFSTGRCCGFAAAGFPIRKSSDYRLFTATRGLSQCPTSFFGTWRQGIHRKPLVASPRDAEKLILFGLHQNNHYNNYSVVKVLFSPLTGDRCASLLSSTRVGCQLFLSTKRPGLSPGRVVHPCDLSHSAIVLPRYPTSNFSSSFQTRSVEMTGFEPVAFALQRRCSPTELHPRALPE